ncbi:MAG: hypothetical protein COA86_00530 [Kangiella sp.]|nr:MAG: hypothetical protein COA86_00530 [Kangiella sp.]
MTDDNSKNNKGSKKADPSNKIAKIDKETVKTEQVGSEPAKKEHVKIQPSKQEPSKKESLPKKDVKIEKPVKNKSKTTTKNENLFNAKPAPKMEASKNKKISWLPIISFILIVLLFSVSGWMFYQQQLTNQSLQTIKNDINNNLQTQNAKVNRITEASATDVYEILKLKKLLQLLANQNDDLKLQLLSVQEKIKSLSGRRKQDWMLAEVEYLINIAELKLSLQKDRNTAIQLLKTADERIIEISDQSLLPIREAIARDISNLSLIQESDITGIVIALNTLDQQIGKLELLAFKFDEVLENKKIENGTQDINAQAESSLSGFSEIYKRFVKEFIVIKNHAETPQPLMTPNQRGNLNRNIQLALQQAQIAALQGNEKLYRLNLNKAINWIVQYFGQGAETVPIIKQLEALRAEKIDVRYPNKLDSATAIELANKNQLYNWLDNSLNPASQQKASSKDVIQETSADYQQEIEEANKQ